MQQGKRAIVIGASSGIGLEVAKLLIEQGWKVGVATTYNPLQRPMVRPFEGC